MLFYILSTQHRSLDKKPRLRLAKPHRLICIYLLCIDCYILSIPVIDIYDFKDTHLHPVSESICLKLNICFVCFIK